MPDAAKVLTLLRLATLQTRRNPARAGGLIRLDAAEEVVVAGDLHGDLATFKRLIDLADLRKHRDRHLVLQELVHGEHRYGEDGGDRSHQLVDVVAALICQYPGRVHLILGNHELSELTGRSIAKNGVKLNALFRRGIEDAYGTAADEVEAAYHQLFRGLPLAARTPNRVFICHTVPDGTMLDRFDVDLLAADDWPPTATARGGTVYAITWGRDTSPETVDRFAELVDADWFVTGHQPCDEGFRRANHRQLIIDGTPPLPCCCLFPTQGPIDLDRLAAGVRPLVG